MINSIYSQLFKNKLIESAFENYQKKASLLSIRLQKDHRIWMRLSNRSWKVFSSWKLKIDFLNWFSPTDINSIFSLIMLKFNIWVLKMHKNLLNWSKECLMKLMTNLFAKWKALRKIMNIMNVFWIKMFLLLISIDGCDNNLSTNTFSKNCNNEDYESLLNHSNFLFHHWNNCLKYNW